MRLVVVANPGSRRVALLDEALARRGRPPAIVVPWIELLNGARLDSFLLPGDVVRIESPGRDAAVEAALVGVGRAPEHGELFFPTRWYDGLRRALERFSPQPEQRWMNDPAEIATLFDKTETQRRFADAGLPTPPPLGPVGSLAEVSAALATLGVRQAFVKLRHGSSASGAIALRTDGRGRWRGCTTVEEDAGRLFNTRRLRTLDDADALDRLIRALAPHGIHAEVWLPKASLNGGGFDVRALTVGGKLRHVVGRISAGPMTNLHLLNRRADAETVRSTVGEKAWDALTELAERAAACFPKSLHVGLDILWTPGLRRLAVLEANAFGDLLPGALWQGRTTYDAELDAIRW